MVIFEQIRLKGGCGPTAFLSL